MKKLNKLIKYNNKIYNIINLLYRNKFPIIKTIIKK